MTIIDRRKGGTTGSTTANRKKFLDRYKRQIKDSVENIADKRRLKDVFKDGSITVTGTGTDEPEFRHERQSGEQDIVLPGNDQFRKGDQIKKPPSQSGKGKSASDSGEGEDDFAFTLTKEEFLDTYFADMALPNFIKETLKQRVQKKLFRAGYTIDGIPSRINIKKTFEQALARRIATRAGGKKPAYFDESDLRYNRFEKRSYKIRKAVMFCLMDVSGSMGEYEKRISKKFFLLLYLFLHKEYEQVEIVFIQHSHVAKEVDEETFFHSRDTGGTIVSTGLELVNDVISDRFPLDEWNVYLAQASDGDNWSSDDSVMVDILKEKILPKVQYMAYIEVHDPKAFFRFKTETIYFYYKRLMEEYPHIQAKKVVQDEDVYPVLKELFTEGGK